MPNIIASAIALGSSLIDSGLISGSIVNAQVQITNEVTNAQVWQKINFVSLHFTAPAQISDYPMVTQSDGTGKLELQALSGNLQRDMPATKVIRPVTTTIETIIDDVSTIESIIAAHQNIVVTFSIQSRGLIAKNMILTRLGLVHEPETLSATRVTMEFIRALQPQTPEAGSVGITRAASDANGSKIGIQSLTSVSNLVNDVASKVKNKISSIF